MLGRRCASARCEGRGRPKTMRKRAVRVSRLRSRLAWEKARRCAIRCEGERVSYERGTRQRASTHLSLYLSACRSALVTARSAVAWTCNVESAHFFRSSSF